MSALITVVISSVLIFGLVLGIGLGLFYHAFYKSQRKGTAPSSSVSTSPITFRFPNPIVETYRDAGEMDKTEFNTPPHNKELTALDFVVDDPQYREMCTKTLIKPTDFKMTNIIDFLKLRETHNNESSNNIPPPIFLGSSKYKMIYYVISNKSSINSIEDIPPGSTLYYNKWGDVEIFRRIMSSVYFLAEEDIDKFVFAPIHGNQGNDGGPNYLNDVCNTYSIQSNPITAMFEKNDPSYLLISFDTQYDRNLLTFFIDKNMGKRLFPLRMSKKGDGVDREGDARHIKRLRNAIYNSDLGVNTNLSSISTDLANKFAETGTLQDHKALFIDTILYTTDLKGMDIGRFIGLDLIDSATVSAYFDLYDISQLPDDLRQYITGVMNNLNLDRYQSHRPFNSTTNNNTENERSVSIPSSCALDSKIQNNDGGYNSYYSTHCVNDRSNFMDIIWPIAEKYDVSLTSFDFNTLRIHSETLDGIVPLVHDYKKQRDIYLKNKEFDPITRLKINVDPSEFPNEVFINDIYYGIEHFEEEDDQGDKIIGSILKNSIPFDFHPIHHEIIEDDPDDDDDPLEFDTVYNETTEDSPGTNVVEEDAGDNVGGTPGTNRRQEPRGYANIMKSTFYIRNTDKTDVRATFTDTTGKRRKVVLLEGDRVFLNVNSLDGRGDRLRLFLNNKMAQEAENYYHGYVEYNSYTTMVSSGEQVYLIIRFDNIRKNDMDDPKGACFDQSYFQIDDNTIQTKGKCENKSGNDNNGAIGRTWDVPCKYNYECPFFQKNKNYKNNYGGCQPNGYCEMPVGIYERSFKHYKVDSQNYPICYNCPVGVPKWACCDETEKAVKCRKTGEGCDALMTPHKFNALLESPDYRFEGDNATRIHHLHLNPSMTTCDSQDQQPCHKLYVNGYN
jgi:hypothetical protein